MKLRRAESTTVSARGDSSGSWGQGGEQSGPRWMTKGEIAMASLQILIAFFLAMLRRLIAAQEAMDKDRNGNWIDTIKIDVLGEKKREIPTVWSSDAECGVERSRARRRSFVEVNKCRTKRGGGVGNSMFTVKCEKLVNLPLNRIKRFKSKTCIILNV